MDKDKFASLVSNPDHPIHAATAFIEGLENRKPQKAKGRIRAIGLIVALAAAVAAIVIVNDLI